ncbi:MAG: hypothetical protein BIFFINMI_02734 [Phycisphaerae bacterium]|nr:hypothetical protein [Phycisphaerae bacterium]
MFAGKKIALLVLAGWTLALCQVASGSLVVDKASAYSRAPWTVSSTDLLGGLLPSAGANTGAHVQWFTDGSGGDNYGENGENWTPYSATTWVEYALNTTSAPLGYSITGVNTFAGTADYLCNQHYTLSFKRMGESSFTAFGTFTNAPWGQQTQVTHHGTAMWIYDSAGAPLVTNVIAVRFDIYTDVTWGLGSTYRELDVLGQATANRTPTAVAGGPYAVDYRSALDLNGGASSDADGTFGDRIVSFEWDLDNDGTFEYLTSDPNLSIPWDDLCGYELGASHPLTLRVTDSFGASSTSLGSFTVAVPEPATVALILLGGCLSAGLRRRRR